MSLLDNFFVIYSGVILIICVLVSAASLMLMERKVLGCIQLRKEPNKVGFLGIKLFTKEQTYPLMSNFYLYYCSPIFNFFIF